MENPSEYSYYSEEAASAAGPDELQGAIGLAEKAKADARYTEDV
jgi:hypothetical protein